MLLFEHFWEIFGFVFDSLCWFCLCCGVLFVFGSNSSVWGFMNFVRFWSAWNATIWTFSGDCGECVRFVECFLFLFEVWIKSRLNSSVSMLAGFVWCWRFSRYYYLNSFGRLFSVSFLILSIGFACIWGFDWKSFQ